MESIVSVGKENKLGVPAAHKLKKKNQVGATNALSKIPPNASTTTTTSSSLPHHNITIPSNHQEAGDKLWRLIEADPQSPTNWWHWIHFLHARCNCEVDQILKMCKISQSNIDTSKFLTDSSYAKILLVQCKFLYSLQHYDAAIEIYRTMYSNSIGRSLYYFWINYATILQKTNANKKAVKILHTALSSVKFSDDDRKKVQSTLDSIVKDIAMNSKFSKSPDSTQNESQSNSSKNLQVSRNTNPLQTPRNIPNISEFATPNDPSGYNIHPRSSTRKPRTLNHFPSKFEGGPERIRKSSGSEVSNTESDSDANGSGALPTITTDNDGNENQIHEEKKTKSTSLKPRDTTPKKTLLTPKETPLVKRTPNSNSTPQSKKIKSTPKSTPDSERKSDGGSNFRLQELVVHGRKYHCLGIMGKGGSSRVIKAIGGKKMDLFAIKQVDLTDQDEQTCEGFKNEINLLCSLKGESNVVHLYDFEITNKRLSLVLELGEIDLRHLLHRLKKSPTVTSQINYIKLYWQQMLEAVAVIHEKRIVHGDLKPANFVSFKGVLKLIDFGIAGAIQSNTTNIKRDSMIGTLNYIAPEALDLNPNPQIKMGVASDVWSLGIILYEMAYHTTPFASITNMFHKVQSIVSDKTVIEFNDIDQPLLVETLKSCLQRDPKQRPTIAELLAHPFLA